MSTKKKSYNDLQAEIERLLAEQKALGDSQLEIFLKKFQNDAFKKEISKIEPAVLKKVADYIVKNFDNIVESTEKEITVNKVKNVPVTPEPIDNIVPKNDNFTGVS